MKVTLANLSGSPVEEVYRAYRVCYSKSVQEDIIIPTECIESKVLSGDIHIADIDKMSEFIKDKIDKGHTSPLEHVSFTFYINDVSRALLAQLTRHRTFKFSVQSQRYVDAENFKFVIPSSISKNKYALNAYKNFMQSSKGLYENLVASGVPKEDARFVLPNATTCNITVTCDLNNFRKFYAQRVCKHAQWEIRELAEKMMEQIKEEVPFAGYKARNCGITCNECIESVLDKIEEVVSK